MKGFVIKQQENYRGEKGFYIGKSYNYGGEKYAVILRDIDKAKIYSTKSRAEKGLESLKRMTNVDVRYCEIVEV